MFLNWELQTNQTIFKFADGCQASLPLASLWASAITVCVCLSVLSGRNDQPSISEQKILRGSDFCHSKNRAIIGADMLGGGVKPTLGDISLTRGLNI